MEKLGGGAWECFADERRILKCENSSLKKIAHLEKEQTEKKKKNDWTAGFKLMLVSLVFKK